MTDFRSNGPFAAFHYVQSSRSPRYPYGVCGPFASEVEAAEALERITAAHPSADVHLEEGGFAGNARASLTSDQDAARLRLEQLAAA
ncbi:hypothetical protein D3C78_1720580 [compost metagenome]